MNDFATTVEDTSVSVAVLANDTDPDNDVLSVISSTQPQQGSATINPGGSVSYTPSTNYNGSDSMTYTISDGYGGESMGPSDVVMTPDGARVHVTNLTSNTVSVIDTSTNARHLTATCLCHL